MHVSIENPWRRSPLRGNNIRMPRPLKSAAQARLEGTYRPYRFAGRELEPSAPGLLAEEKAPAWLNEPQKRLWRQAVADAPIAVLRRIDRHTFLAFILNADVVIEVAKEHNKTRQLLDAEGKPSPYLRLLRQHGEALVTLAAQLGFTPQARIRLGVPMMAPAPPEPENPHARFDVVMPDGRRVPYGQGGAGAGGVRNSG